MDFIHGEKRMFSKRKKVKCITSDYGYGNVKSTKFMPLEKKTTKQ